MTGKRPCNDRHALNWAGVLALASLAVGTALALMNKTEGVIILVFGTPGTVVGMIAGYIGGRSMASQTTNTGPTEHVTITSPASEPTAASIDPAEAGG